MDIQINKNLIIIFLVFALIVVLIKCFFLCKRKCNKKCHSKKVSFELNNSNNQIFYIDWATTTPDDSNTCTVKADYPTPQKRAEFLDLINQNIAKSYSEYYGRGEGHELPDSGYNPTVLSLAKCSDIANQHFAKSTPTTKSLIGWASDGLVTISNGTVEYKPDIVLGDRLNENHGLFVILNNDPLVQPIFDCNNINSSNNHYICGFCISDV